jgi:hypothetical protein
MLIDTSSRAPAPFAFCSLLWRARSPNLQANAPPGISVQKKRLPGAFVRDVLFASDVVMMRNRDKFASVAHRPQAK